MLTPIERPTFVVYLRPEPDCSDPIKALRELLKRALRSWGLRCVYLSQNSAPSARITAGELASTETTAQGGPTRHDV
jgi:hypothetical protein